LSAARAQAVPEQGETPLVVATWPFSKPSHDAAGTDGCFKYALATPGKSLVLSNPGP
jgi:hypothetical protein